VHAHARARGGRRGTAAALDRRSWSRRPSSPARWQPRRRCPSAPAARSARVGPPRGRPQSARSGVGCGARGPVGPPPAAGAGVCWFDDQILGAAGPTAARGGWCTVPHAAPVTRAAAGAPRAAPASRGTIARRSRRAEGAAAGWVTLRRVRGCSSGGGGGFLTSRGDYWLTVWIGCKRPDGAGGV